MSQFLQVYMADINTITEESLTLTISPVEEAVGDIIASIKEKLLKWFKIIKDKVIGFFSNIKGFIVKIANIIINKIKALNAKCKELARKYGVVKEEWTDEELESGKREFMYTEIGGKVAKGFTSSIFNGEWMEAITDKFNKFQKAANTYNDKDFDEAVKSLARFNDSYSYYSNQIFGANVMVPTDQFDESGSEKFINNAKDVCNGIISKLQGSFNKNITELENKVKTDKNLTSDKSAFIQKCVNT